jgi:hypothetical protein
LGTFQKDYRLRRLLVLDEQAGKVEKIEPNAAQPQESVTASNDNAIPDAYMSHPPVRIPVNDACRKRDVIPNTALS